jgi:hypothetical protein
MDFKIDGRVQKLDGLLLVVESEDKRRNLGEMKILPRGRGQLT